VHISKKGPASQLLVGAFFPYPPPSVTTLVLEMLWPKIMKNVKVDNCDKPASNIIQKRSQMPGHVLRMEDNVPAKTLTIKPISDQQHMRKKRGRPPTTLTNTVVAYLKRYNTRYKRYRRSYLHCK